ncbi:MAG: glycosyltransferase [Deltaproteobacteria bacterium]|nr:glycosyltransferase [Deltaproteobacteria bacterium]
MKVAILTMGTRGDLQPFVAIGCALLQRGHDVVICAPRDLTPFAAQAGLQTVSLPLSAQEILNSETGKALLANGHLLRFLRTLKDMWKGHEQQTFEACATAAAGADVLLASHIMVPAAFQLAQHMGVPLVRVYMAPIMETAAFASPLLTTVNLGALNRLTHRAVDVLAWRTSKANAAGFARHIGAPLPKDNLLQAAERAGGTVLHGYSSVLFHKPTDWGEHHVIAGMIQLPKAARARVGEAVPPPELLQWLDNGPPPVFFGFGSMPVIDPAATLKMVEDVAADCGVRALVGAGWSDLRGGSANTLIVGTFDHDAILPRCRAAVHHGGCGTTHAVLRAGLPSVVCSFLGDQPFWASRLRRLGVGAHLQYKGLTRAKLTAALRTVLDDDSVARARALSLQIQAEDGASVCADHIERRRESTGINAA